MNTELFEPISETSYLATGNTFQYRAIMRLFYEEYEKMRFQLTKEEVYELLKRYPEFERYTVEQLRADLDALVEWKNLTPMQDPRKVKTIAEYKNRQFRYSMSEYAVEIERMTVKLENLFLESATLSGGLFGRLYAQLREMDSILERASLKETNEWWRNLQDDFKRLNQNYQDYLRDFYSSRSEQVLKSMEFLVHKDHFIKYLKEFVQALQQNGEKIAICIKRLSKAEQAALLDKVVRSELDIPRPKSERAEHQQKLEEYIRENVTGKWNSLRDWFVEAPQRPSDSSQVMEVTNEVIRRLIQNAALILQMQSWGISRKEDYRKYIRMFADCEDLNEAHRLSAHLFGIQQIRHFRVNGERTTDSIYSGVFEEEPLHYSLESRNKAYKPRTERSAFEDKSWEKEQQRQEILRNRLEEQKRIMKFVRDGKLRLWEVNEVIAPSTRACLLNWISLANSSGSRSGRTEFGEKFRLEREEGECQLNCEDGLLILPRFVLCFEEVSETWKK